MKCVVTVWEAIVGIYCPCRPKEEDKFLSMKPRIRGGYQVISDCSEVSDRNSYPLICNQTCHIAILPCWGCCTMPIIHGTCCIIYFARHPSFTVPLHADWTVVMYTHHQNDICVTFFTAAPLRLSLFTQRLAMNFLLTGQMPDLTSP